MEKDMNEIVEWIRKGKEEWQGLLSDYNIQDDEYVILLDSSEKEFLYYSLLYLKSFVNGNERRIHLFVTEPLVLKYIEPYDIKVNIELIYEHTFNSIMMFYNLYMFTDKLIILSPTLPNGRSAYNLVKQGIIDLEEFISVGLLQNREFKRASFITYDGTEPELIEFFDRQRRDT